MENFELILDAFNYTYFFVLISFSPLNNDFRYLFSAHKINGTWPERPTAMAYEIDSGRDLTSHCVRLFPLLSIDIIT